MMGEAEVYDGGWRRCMMGVAEVYDGSCGGV